MHSLDPFNGAKARSILGLNLLRLLAAFALFLFAPHLLSGQSGRAGDERITLGMEVNDAIKKGVAFLRLQQKENGEFHAVDDAYPEGSAALCMLAMLKSGVYRSDPAVQKTLAYLRYMKHRKTYSTGVRILALDALDDRDQDSFIRAAAQWLLEHFHTRDHLWAYPDRICDLSNTQYAVLGLWAAGRHGFTAPDELWTDLANGVMKLQNENGGFRYSPLRGESSGSMTTAGIFILEVCLEKIQRNRALKTEIQAALGRAWDFMDRRFSISGNPIGDHTFVKQWLFYYLYGLERACALSGRETVGGRDWYREGAMELVNAQSEDGRWNDSIDTAFALLFLRLSTYTSVDRKHKTNLDGSGTGRMKGVKPDPRIPFARNWLLLGPFDHRKEAGFAEDLIGEEEIDPKERKRTGKLRWVKHRSVSEAVDLGRAHDVHPTGPLQETQVLAYAFTRFVVEREEEAILWFGSDDAARIRLDGKPVFEYPFRCEDAADTHRVALTLTEGVHRLLVKVLNFDGRWYFYLRFSRPDGSPIPGLVPFTGSDGPDVLELFDGTAPLLALGEILNALPLDRKEELDFSAEGDLDRFAMVGNSHPDPLEGYRVIKQRIRAEDASAIALQAMDPERPCRIYRKIPIPSRRTEIVARLAAFKRPPDVLADWVARIGIYDGTLTWLAEEVISAREAPYPRGWKEITADLAPFAGKDVLAVLECTGGGQAADGSHGIGYVSEFSTRNY